MKLIHVADVHASHARINETIKILNAITERAASGDIDFTMFTGDFFDGTMTNTKASGFTDIVSLMKGLQDKCRIIMIYGTALHEPDGCLDVFKSDRCLVVDKNSVHAIEGTSFVCLPEPRRGRYISTSEKSINDSINRDEKEFIASVRTSGRTIVLYHGEIKGAVYPNGVKATSPIGITSEQMKSLNADYYACGHIHLPQEPFKNCFYAGSAAPVNFGECHDGGYNVVTIDGAGTKVERVSFGFPRNVTLCLNYKDYLSLDRDFTGLNVKIVVDCTVDEAKGTNTVSDSARIKEASHAASATVELQAEQVTNIRSTEMSKKRTNREKLEEYVKVNSVEVPKGTYEELQNIEDNQLIKYFYPVHSFTLEYASIKGAIGIKDGTGKDEIEVDFTKYSPGVLVLMGVNGNGKSTFIEMCQPYPRMVTRTSVSFAENFFLKDSHKILIYRDENGLRYRITMLIDAHIKSGKILYFVETSKEGESWKNVPGVDGSLKSYNEYVDRTFGTIEVFLRTAFLAKEPTKNIPDIASATKGDRMELLASLYGSDCLTDISKSASEKSKDIGKDLASMKSEYGSIAELESQVSEDKRLIKDKSKLLDVKEPQLASYKSELKSLEAKDRKYRDYLAEEKQSAILVESYRKEVSRLKSDLETMSEKMKSYSKYLKNKDRVERMRTDSAALEILSANKEKLSNELNVILGDINSASKRRSELKSEIETKETISRKIGFDIDMERSKYVEIGDRCPTCGEPLKASVKERLESSTKSHLVNAESLAGAKKNIDESLAEPNVNLEKVEKEISTLEEKKKSIEECIANNDKELASSKNRLEEYSDIDEFLKNIPEKADESDTGKIESQIKELEEKIEGPVRASPEDVSKELSDIKEKCSDTNDEVHELKAAIKVLEEDVSKKSEIINGSSEAKKNIQAAERRIKSLDFLTTAFGNKGIQALELESSAPQIALIANRILAKSYGDRFSIRFETLRQSKGKDIEDFNIMVYDSTSGREKALDLLCSGEKIWVKQSLAYAFGIVRKNRTGFNFNTQFIDESDGSLDSEMRQKYYSMIKSAHNESGAVLTILITHSSEIKDIAEQTLCLSD